MSFRLLAAGTLLKLFLTHLLINIHLVATVLNIKLCSLLIRSQKLPAAAATPCMCSHVGSLKDPHFSEEKHLPNSALTCSN